MRVVELQVDMVSEQKNLLGFISTRQGIYLGIGGVILYTIIPPVFKLVNFIAGILPAVIVALILAAPFATCAIYLAFMKNTKTEMFKDKELFLKFKSKFETGHWRSGYRYNN